MELMAIRYKMSWVMLTVFKDNEGAMNFYKNLKYVVHWWYMIHILKLEFQVHVWWDLAVRNRSYERRRTRDYEQIFC